MAKTKVVLNIPGFNRLRKSKELQEECNKAAVNTYGAENVGDTIVSQTRCVVFVEGDS